MNWFVARVFLSVCDTHVCMCVCQFIHSQRPEVVVRCFLLFLSTPEQDLLLSLELMDGCTSWPRADICCPCITAEMTGSLYQLDHCPGMVFHTLPIHA